MLKLVELAIGGQKTFRFEAHDVNGAMQSLGYTFTKMTPLGGALRAELKDQPQYAGLLGPCWGGYADDGVTPVLRYEDQATYTALSSD